MASTRRNFLKIIGGSVGSLFATAAGGTSWMSLKSKEKPVNYEPGIELVASKLPATPSCGSDPTLQQTAGPFYTPDTPHRANLREPGMKGQPLLIEGRVLTTECRPVAGAVVDVWSCDADGVYDNEGYTLRGHVFTNADGHYRIETIRPRHYGGGGFVRTPHIHVKVHGHGTRLLTTQLYFPREPRNRNDGIFDKSLLMSIKKDGDGSLKGRFDFVLESVT